MKYLMLCAMVLTVNLVFVFSSTSVMDIGEMLVDYKMIFAREPLLIEEHMEVGKIFEACYICYNIDVQLCNLGFHCYEKFGRGKVRMPAAKFHH